MKLLHSNNAPKAVGPYSVAIEENGFVFCSGQIGINPKTGELVSGIEQQTRQVLTNIKAVLTDTGINLENVVKTTIYLSDMEDYAQVNLIYAEYFNSHKPARSTVAVCKLPKNALIEIELIAFDNKSSV